MTTVQEIKFKNETEKEGYDDAFDGKFPIDNPYIYEKEPQKYNDWENGWFKFLNKRH